MEIKLADEPREMLLVYDQQCPVCHAYCGMIQPRESAGVLRLVDARDPSEIMDEVTAKGLDIDQGMVLRVGNVLYYGADAIRALSLVSRPTGVFNRLNSVIFRSKTRSRTLYPVLRLFRNLLLKALRKTKINNLGIPRNERF
jgi:predicted DCC family thiol-disulfide oxidoreductase YuxK